MTTQELKQYIDRVLGNSIRCLLPSYWWKRLFGMVIDALSVLEKELKNKAEKLKVSNLADSVEYQWNRLTKVENSLNQVSSNVKQVKILYIDDNDDLTSEQKEINKETLNSMYSDIVIGSVHTIKYKEDYDIVVYVRSLFYTPVVLIDAMFDGSSVILYCSAPYLLNYPLGKVLKVDFNRNTGGINSYELVDNITVDTSLSTTSTNLVQNKVITTAINGKVGKNELKTINGKSILGQGDITIEGGEGGDGVLRIYASNLFNAITEEMLIPEGEELPEEELTFVNTILSTNAKTYNKIIEHYNSLSTLSPIGMTNAIIDYSLIDGFNSGVFTSTPASIVIANVNNELTVSIVPQNEYKSLTSTSGGNFPFLSGWNLNSNGDVKRLEIGTLFVNLADNTLINDGIAAEINNYTKTAIQNGYIDANMVKLVYPLDMGIFEELLAAGASTNAMIAQFGSYFLTSQPIAISYDESLSRNRLFTLGIDGGIITIDIT